MTKIAEIQREDHTSNVRDETCGKPQTCWMKNLDNSRFQVPRYNFGKHCDLLSTHFLLHILTELDLAQWMISMSLVNMETVLFDIRVFLNAVYNLHCTRLDSWNNYERSFVTLILFFLFSTEVSAHNQAVPIGERPKLTCMLCNLIWKPACVLSY